MTFFSRIIASAAQSDTEKEVSDKLNAMEIDLFRACPWILELPEAQQDDIVEYVWKIISAKKN
jgi:hypothetical protein